MTCEVICTSSYVLHVSGTKMEPPKDAHVLHTTISWKYNREITWESPCSNSWLKHLLLVLYLPFPAFLAFQHNISPILISSRQEHTTFN